MECIILVGLPGAGKSTYYQENFSDTHVRVNLDMLKNRKREHALLQSCLLSEMKFVVDNTNLTKSLRAKYIALAKIFNFKVKIIDLKVDLPRCLRRNRLRNKPVPEKAIHYMYRTYEPPTEDEGELLQVKTKIWQENEIRQKLFSLFEVYSLQDGITHPAEVFLEEISESEAGLRVVEQIILDSNNPAVGAHLLLCASRIPELGTIQWRRNLIQISIDSNALDLRDVAAQVIDSSNWETRDYLDILLSHHETVPYLRDYICTILEEMDR